MGVCYTFTAGAEASGTLDIRMMLRNGVFGVSAIAAVLSFAGLWLADAGTESMLFIGASVACICSSLMSSERLMASAVVMIAGLVLSAMGASGLL